MRLLYKCSHWFFCVGAIVLFVAVGIMHYCVAWEGPAVTYMAQVQDELEAVSHHESLYSVLGLTRSSTSAEEIRAAYGKAVQMAYTSLDQGEAHHQLFYSGLAASILLDPVLKNHYDGMLARRKAREERSRETIGLLQGALP